MSIGGFIFFVNRIIVVAVPFCVNVPLVHIGKSYMTLEV